MYVVLIKDISIEDNNNNCVFLAKGETIYVEEETGTAWTEDIVFEIEPTEYVVIH